MKPLSSPSFSLPLACGLAALPLWVEAPLWGAAATLGAAAWAYAAWRSEVDRRAPLPELAGERFEPLDVAISWRTPSGESPALRRGWRATLTETDLWLGPLRPSRLLGGDRDHVRVPRLDVVGVVLASETELRVRFLDDEGRAQEARLSHVPRALELATALGLSEDRGTKV